MANEINQIKVGSTTYTLQDSRVDSLVTGVSSVNGKTGDVTIGIPTTPSEVGAAPSASGTYFVNGTQTASTNAWTGTLAGITPYDGLAIRYYLPYAGTSTGATLALNGGTAYPVYRLGTTTQITTHFGAGSVIAMTFRTSYNVAGTTKTNAWICEAFYDSNTNTQVRVYRQDASGYNKDYPLIASRTVAADLGTVGTEGSYESVYGLISDTAANIPTTNPYTGEVKAKKLTVSGDISAGNLAAVATSGAYSDLSGTPTIPDISGKANLSGGNTFSGNQTIAGNSGDTPLTVQSAATTSYIGMKNTSGTMLGYYGFSAKDTPAVYLSSGAKTIYHAGNLSSATTSDAGLMSAADKTKLNGISDISQLDLWYDAVGDLAVTSGGITWSDSFALIDSDDNTQIGGSLTAKVPIVAGSNIAITKNASGMAAITYTCGTWSSGTSGTVKLPSAGTYQVRYLTGYTSVLWWNGSGTAHSQLIRANAVGACYRFYVAASGTLTLKTGSMTTTTETDNTYTIYYRRIGD